MSKVFKLNGNPIDVEISPTLAETLDESLDNMTLSLAIDENEQPYAPLLNKISIYERDSNQNEELLTEFLISADNVELVGQNPLRYKHTVSLIQTSQYLTHHLIRNTVFSTSLEYANNDSFLIGGNVYYKVDTTSIAYQFNFHTKTLSAKKINSILLKPKFLAFKKTSVNHYTVGGGGGTDVEEYYDYSVQDMEVEKWSEIFGSGQIPTYPTIYFEIYQSNVLVETLELRLSDFYQNEYIYVPQSILNTINSYTSGQLKIGIRANVYNLSDWTLSPYTDVNVPIYTKLVFETYYDIAEFSVYDVIYTLIKQYRKDTKLYHDATDLFKMPDATHHSDFYNLLKDTQAPNFVFTQASMFDALSEIFRLFDATFRIDKDGYLDIEYFNERKQSDKFNFTDSMKAGRMSSLGEERYSNRLISFFQNTQVEDRFPNSISEKSTAYLRSKTLGVPGMEDFVFEVPKNIDFIKKVMVTANYNITSKTYSLTPPHAGIDFSFERVLFTDAPFNKTLDITDSVIESSYWSILPSVGSINPFITGQRGKQNTISYERGTKYINACSYYKITNETLLLNTQMKTIRNVIKIALCKELGATSLNGWETNFSDISWRDLKMSVEYVALVDGKLVNESIDNKYDGEIFINQDNGSIDINKLGLNMVGLSLKLGQPTLTMTQKFTTWTNRIKKGQWFIKNGEIWVANTCSYTLITNNTVQATIEFVKNFNSLASRIQLNREKRLSNISNELTTKCEENYGEFIYFTDNTSFNENPEVIALNDQYVKETLLAGIGIKPENTKKIEYALLTALDENNNIISLKETGNVENIAVPMVVYGSGSSVCFEMSFDSPISAGNQLLDNYSHLVSDSTPSSDYWVEVVGWFSRAILYTDEYGVANKFTINFVSMDEDLTRLFPVMKKQIIENTDYSPSNLEDLDFTSLGKLEEFAYYKKSNEIFALNYQLHFLPYKESGRGECFLGNEFIKNNGFAKGTNFRKFRFVYTVNTNDFEYSILDTKGEAQYNCDFETKTNLSTNYVCNATLILNLSVTEANRIKTWALVDENNNIYFASNNPISFELIGGVVKPVADIVFFTRHHRI